MIFSKGSTKTKYVKFLYTPYELGLGASLYMEEDGSGWEFTIFLVCFQLWIGA